MKPIHIVLALSGNAKLMAKSAARAKQHVGNDGRVIAYRTSRSLDFSPHGLKIAHGVGRSALLDALASLPAEEFTVHVSSTAVYDRTTLEILRSRAQQTGALVVPWTNDIGTDQSLSRSTAGGDLEQQLISLRAQSPGTRDDARTVRPSFIGGTRSQLVGLVPFHASYPLTTLRLIEDPAHVPAGAIVLHSKAARELLLPPLGLDDRPLLVATMIVRDEEAMLDDCLRSLRGVVDRIDLCDTGSTDATLEIARRHGANVIERAWTQDFAEARNHALELSRDAWWALWIDADERLHVSDPVGFRRELATAIDHFEAVNVRVGEGGADSLDAWLHARVFRPDLCHFEGALHERVVLNGSSQAPTPATMDHVVLEHLGYTSTVIASKDKSARNLAIARAAFEASPDDAVAALHYARSLGYAGKDLEEQITHYGSVVAKFEESSIPAPTRAQVMALYANALIQGDRLMEAMEVAGRALDLVPVEDLALETFMLAAYQQGDKAAVLARYEDAMTRPSLRPVLEVPRSRDRATSVVVTVLVERGELRRALEITKKSLRETGGHGFGSWHPLIAAMLQQLPGEEFVDALNNLLQLDRGAGWVQAVVKLAGGEIALELIEAQLAQGAPLDCLRVGLTLAMVRKDWRTFRRLAKYRDELPADDRHSLGERLTELGQAKEAALIRPSRVKEGWSVLKL